MVRARGVPRRRVVSWVGAALAVVLLAAGCSSRASAGAGAVYTVRQLTTTHGDHYVLDTRGGAVTFKAPKSNKSIATRQAFWPTGQHKTVDGEACVTWSLQNGTNDPYGVTQEGVVLRLATDGSRTRAITITKNIFEGYIWFFNVHVWDTKKKKSPYTEVGAHTMAPMVWTPKLVARLPWHLCARVTGRTLQFVVWPESGVKPTYTDPKGSATITLPKSYVFAGNFGGYIGHIKPGQTATFSGLSTGP